MLSSLSNFDPIAFLGINTNDIPTTELIQLRNELNSKVGEYILLKSSEYLTAEQLEEVTKVDGQQMLDDMQKYIPDIDNKLSGWLSDFKNEYDKQKGTI